MRTSRVVPMWMVAVLAAVLVTAYPGRAEDGALGARLLERADQVFQQARMVHYRHLRKPAGQQVVQVNGGLEVECDCSGFVSFLLQEVAPAQYEAVRETAPNLRHPVAATYARFLHGLRAGQPHHGWHRVRHWQALRPGDILAWEKERASMDHGGGGNSGHIAIVTSPPLRREEAVVRGRHVSYVSIDVIDSSSVEHFPPQQLPPLAAQQKRDGLGRGRIRLILDDEERPIGYWEGTWWGEGHKRIKSPSYTRVIGMGRLAEPRLR